MPPGLPAPSLLRAPSLSIYLSIYLSVPRGGWGVASRNLSAVNLKINIDRGAAAAAALRTALSSPQSFIYRRGLCAAAVAAAPFSFSLPSSSSSSFRPGQRERRRLRSAAAASRVERERERRLYARVVSNAP